MDGSSKYILIEENSKMGLMDSNGRIIFEPIYEGIDMRREHLVTLYSGSKVKLFNLKTSKYEPFSAENIV